MDIFTFKERGHNNMVTAPNKAILCLIVYRN